MNSREAKEILKEDPGDLITGSQYREYGRAKGFLEAMKSEEVMRLVEALEEIKNYPHGSLTDKETATKALKAWKESVR